MLQRKSSCLKSWQCPVVSHEDLNQLFFRMILIFTTVKIAKIFVMVVSPLV